MKANQLLLAAILVSAIGVPTVTLAAEKRVVQQMTTAAVQLPIEGELPSLGGATEWLRLPLVNSMADFVNFTFLNGLPVPQALVILVLTGRK